VWKLLPYWRAVSCIHGVDSQCPEPLHRYDELFTELHSCLLACTFHGLRSLTCAVWALTCETMARILGRLIVTLQDLYLHRKMHTHVHIFERYSFPRTQRSRGPNHTHLRLRGHWHRHLYCLTSNFLSNSLNW